MAFPSALKVKDLAELHPAFNPKRVKRNQLLYDAGEDYRNNVRDFLIKRPIEKEQAGCAHYEARLEKAWPIPRGPGAIDWMVAAAFKRDPKITAPADKTGFWEGLNKNVDGLGTDLPALMRRALREIMVQGRGYFAVNFPGSVGHPTDAASMAASIRLLTAPAVGDWLEDAHQNLLWVRTDSCYRPRPNPWEAATVERQLWTFITPQEIAEYGYDKPLDPSKAEADPIAILLTTSGLHQFPGLPVFPIRAGREVFVMDRIADILINLFNREVSITCALDQIAYSLLVLKLDTTEINQIVASSIAALKIKPGEEAGFTSPPPAITEPLFKDAERLKQALYEVIQALAINAAATQTQNARQSAEAKKVDRDPLQTLLQSFTWPVKDAMEQLIEKLKLHRGEKDLEVIIEGMEAPADVGLDDLATAINSPNAPLKDAPINQE